MRNRGKDEPSSRANSAVRGGGFVLLLVASCGLASLNWDPGVLRFSAGGRGRRRGRTKHLTAALQYLGATLLLLAAWMGGLSLAFGVSWLTIMDAPRRVDLARHRLDPRARAGARARSRRDASASRRARMRRSASRENPPRAFRRASTRRRRPWCARASASRRNARLRSFEPPAANELPALQLLDDPPPPEASYSAEALEALSRLVEMKLKDFAIDAEVVAVQPGPVVTRFELRPAPGVKASQITGLAKDLARALAVLSVRVVEVIPGKNVMGLEIANEKREIVTLGEIVRSKAYDDMHSPLALALGKDIGGHPVVADLARMPHLLIAGTTGSGKSVAINAMVLSLLYKSTAEHVRLVMIDPKMLELSVYEGIPHLLAPVVTDMKQAANALRWSVAEMERRYQLMAALGVRNIAGCNRRVSDAIKEGKPDRATRCSCSAPPTTRRSISRRSRISRRCPTSWSSSMSSPIS